MAEFAGADWWEDVAKRSTEVIFPVIDLLLATYLADGRAPGTAKITWPLLTQMPPQEAIKVISNMMLQPDTQADGLKFMRQLLDELATQGQDTTAVAVGG